MKKLEKVKRKLFIRLKEEKSNEGTMKEKEVKKWKEREE